METSDNICDYINGEILLFDKPYGWTSFDLVGKIRNYLSRELKIQRLKVGHAGTLDPLATGLMIICTGKATRQIESLQALEKEYTATLKMGATTPSFDMETAENQFFEINHITENTLKDILKQFTGKLDQVPPLFSAIKIEGKRAYTHARAGKDTELKPRNVFIREIEMLSFESPFVKIRVVCSKGTYIRSLVRDIGKALESGAYLTALRRTRTGDFYVQKALTFDDFKNQFQCKDIKCN
jgi:tRNA pseudouridine55 synthase